ncbi:MAG: carboxypeptidase-like regulatory domain-containing protein [Myxococcota bacterium]
MLPRWTVLVGCLGLACATPLLPDPVRTPGTPDPDSVLHVGRDPGRISGQLIDSRQGTPLGSGLVLLTCSCFEEQHEIMTDDEGRFAFEGLPAGSYTVEALHGPIDEVRTLELRAGENGWVGVATDRREAETYCLEPGVQPRTAHCPY